MNFIKKLDYFPKIDQDINSTSSTGGLYSIVAIFIAVVLFVKEYQLFKEPLIEKEFVISPIEADNISVFVNLTFFHAPCQILSLDYQDENSGDHKSNIPLKKIRLSEYGDIINDVLGKGQQNYENSDQELKDFQDSVYKKEACRYEGSFSLKKSPGNFHISFHARQDLMDRLKASRYDLFPSINLDHQINELYFGNYDGYSQKQQSDGTLINIPKHMFQKDSPQELILKHYFKFNKTEYAPYNKIVFLGDQKFDYENYIKILPIKFEFPNIKGQNYNEMDTIQELYQFSMASTKIPKMGNEITSVYFRYQVSPLNLIYTLKYQKFYHFIVQILAIIGGVIAVLGIVASGTNAIVDQLKKSFNKVSKELLTEEEQTKK